MDQKSTAADFAELIVSRNADYDIKMRGLEIFVDGKFAHDLSYPKSWSTQLSPGQHTIEVSNHLYKKSIDVQAIAGQKIELLAGNRFTPVGGIMVTVLGMGPYRVFLTEQSPAGKN